MFELDEKYMPVQIGIEEVAFQRVLRFFVEEEMSKRGHFLPLEPLKPDSRSKKDRIRGLQPRFERGIIYLREGVYWLDRFMLQYRRFPNVMNDDMLDALAYQLDIAFPPRAEEARTVKKDYLNSLTKY